MEERRDVQRFGKTAGFKYLRARGRLACLDGKRCELCQ